MVDYGKKYEKIVEQLVGRSFPELEIDGVKVFEFRKGSLDVLFLPLRKREVNFSCRDFLDSKLRGILAHELCHVEIFRGYGIFRIWFLYLSYWIFK